MHILATTVATGVKKLYHDSAILSITIADTGKITSFSHLNDTAAAATIDAAAAVGTTIYEAGCITKHGASQVIWSNV
jgi:hypothetical protein